MFPKVSREIGGKQETVKIKFLTEDMELVLDREKCRGCGTCARVCPKEAVRRGPIGATKRFPTREDIIAEVYDPKKCVFCGTCVVMCPFSALTLKINGQVVNLEDIPIVAKKAVPKLVFNAKKLKTGAIAKQYATGKVSVVDAECAKGCATCAEVCPSETIVVGKKPEHGWESSKNVEVADPDACVACGACDNACPTGAVKLEITDVKYDGEFNEPFWPDIIKRLKTMRCSQPIKEGAKK